MATFGAGRLAAALAAVVVLTSCVSDRDQIALQTRACAIEGSPQAGDAEPGEVGTGNLNSRIRSAGNVWHSEANIRIGTQHVYLVIADPSPPGSPGGEGFLGDVKAGFLALEPRLSVQACEMAWATHDREALGVIVVNARAFTGAGLTLGVTPSVPHALRVASASPLTGKRGDDLCGDPRQLTADDLAATSWTVVVDGDLFGGPTYSGDPIIALAHEFGHVLTLGHGNGLDDNGDGLQPPGNGPRRFDSYCDPLATDASGVPVEEADVGQFVDCEASSSMMRTTLTSCRNLRPLQVEQARAAALKIPGTSLGGVFVDVDA
jgi:hypothetical protein